MKLKDGKMKERVRRRHDAIRGSQVRIVTAEIFLILKSSDLLHGGGP